MIWWWIYDLMIKLITDDIKMVHVYVMITWWYILMIFLLMVIEWYHKNDGGDDDGMMGCWGWYDDVMIKWYW